MTEQESKHYDRRSDEDRRKVHDLDYFFDGNVERRRFNEQRVSGERRTSWAATAVLLRL